MKNKIILNLLFAIGCISAQADIVIPGANGTDGALNITADTVIDLSQAPTGTWDQDNSTNAGKGVYDPEKWAVVFKYTGINIAAGANVTFKNNASRAPVVWLVSGNVSIEGTVDLSGESAQNVWSSSLDGWAWEPTNRPLGGRLTEPGPGGFRGGAPWRGGNVLSAAGFGPGGGRVGTYVIGYQDKGSSGGFGTDATRWLPLQSGRAYGNPSLVPLIGGSGGGGSSSHGWGRAGGAGGGAILIACANQISLSSGQINANGGNGDWDSNGAGSGGGVRLVCETLSGSGSIAATGGNGTPSTPGSGRIRLERVSNSNTINVAPSPSALDLADGATAMLWPPSSAPQAKVLSVNAVNTPSDPKASFGTFTPDVALPLVSSVQVVVETVNVEQASTVVVRVTPRNGMIVNTTDTNGNPTTRDTRDANEANATVQQVVSTNPLTIRWAATVPALPGHSAVQARIIRP